MAIQPKGLSPDFNSIVSSSIPSSLIFSWTFIKESKSDSQKSAEIKVYPKGSNTPIITKTVNKDTSIDLTADVPNFTVGNLYEWEVKVTAANNSIASSGKKPFKFTTVQLSPSLDWQDGPDPYEYIGTRNYFNDIKTNAGKVLGDYIIDSPEETKYKTIADNLFMGDIVPSRIDFVNIEDILAFIGEKESTYKDEVDSLIEDGLGAGDIHKVYGFFDRLTKIPPKDPSNVYLVFSGITMYGIASATASNQSDEDLTVDTHWTPQALPQGICTINFNSDLDEDISYYHIQLNSGFKDYQYGQSLYFRVDDMAAINRKVSVPMDHIVAQHLSSTRETQYEVIAQAIDRRGGVSSSYSKEYNVANVPLGIDNYELKVKRMNLANTSTVKDYYGIYTGNNTAYVHTVSGEGVGYYYYAVRLTDINGLSSDWFYIPTGIKIDPLKPPAPPKPRLTGQTTDWLLWEWDAVKDADSYDLKLWNGDIYHLNETKSNLWSLAEGTAYTVWYRSCNRAGNSDWVAATAKTKSRPIVEQTQRELPVRSWRTGYFIYHQSGRKSYPSAEYRYDLDGVEAIHGEWIELRNKYESGMYVKKGTRWGNHKSLFFLNYGDWQNKLQGKEILKVSFYIKRKTTQHGYPYDGRFLHVWAHSYDHWALPPEWAGPDLGYHHKIENLDWNRGEGHWVDLPIYYGELLRDGKIKGIAFHHPSSTNEPYSYMRFDANTFQFRIKYK